MEPDWNRQGKCSLVDKMKEHSYMYMKWTITMSYKMLTKNIDKGNLFKKKKKNVAKILQRPS